MRTKKEDRKGRKKEMRRKEEVHPAKDSMIKLGLGSVGVWPTLFLSVSESNRTPRKIGADSEKNRNFNAGIGTTVGLGRNTSTVPLFHCYTGISLTVSNNVN